MDIFREKTTRARRTHHYLVWHLHWIDVQSSPDDLISLNTKEDHSPHRVLLSIGLHPIIVQLCPYGISFFHLAQYLYLYIWNRLEEEAPVFPHACLPGEVQLRVERLLTAIVRSKTRHHSVQIVAIQGLYHAL